MSQYALRWIVAWRRVAWRRRTGIVDPVQQVRAVVPDAVDRPTDRPEMYQTVVGWLHEAGWVPCPFTQPHWQMLLLQDHWHPVVQRLHRGVGWVVSPDYSPESDGGPPRDLACEPG